LNSKALLHKRKAAISACLFLFIPLLTFSQDFQLDASTLSAYHKALNLAPDSARLLLKASSSVGDQYVQALSEALEVILTEDAEKFSSWESNFEKRADRKGTSADEMFFQAEIHLQWAFVYLKFGHEFDAAVQLRKAYSVTRELKKKHPEYRAILKTSGLLNVLIGSVPDKYQWVLDMLDIHGDVSQGLKELESLMHSNHVLAYEASLWYAFSNGFILQKPLEGITALRDIHENLAAMFLAANLHVKNSMSENALQIIREMEQRVDPRTFPYLKYLKGEILLQRGDYAESIGSYESFLQHYHGQNYLKDAYYKMGICYWILNKTGAADKEFENARSVGNETTEADKYAARALMDKQPPHVSLIKLRYFTDGGYYPQALSVVSAIDENTFPDQKEQVEFLYRKARLYHKLNDLPKAILLYSTTIERNGDSEWYFAPNACLQLGYIAMQQNRTKEARDYFHKALSYRKHEYKNSIDTKARSALAQLRERK
jgi:tetratricopeptide (TPR) repeat protein